MSRFNYGNQDKGYVMPEHATLVNKTPILFGEQDRFLGLGVMEIRGDKFIVFMDLSDGKVFIEESFATHAMGDFLVGLNYINDDKLWNMCVYAANGYGLTSQEHITECVKTLNLKSSNPIVKDILNGKPPGTASLIK